MHPTVRNTKSETCIPEDFQDGSRSNFHKSDINEYLVQNSGSEEEIFGNSLVAGNSYSKCQNSHQYNSQSCENLKSCCKKDNSKIIRCEKNPITGCDTNLHEKFSKDTKCSHSCTGNPDMDVRSKNSGTNKWQVSENKKFQRECSVGWTDNQRITNISKVSDSEMVDVNERLNSANGSPSLEEEDREISSERSSVELVPLSHANRSVLWNFGSESPAPNDQNGNLVDLILGSKSEECIKVHKNEMVPVFSENEKKQLLNKKEQKVFKKAKVITSKEEPKDPNSEFNNNDYDGDDDDDDDNSSLLGEIRKSKSLLGESFKQRFKRIKEVKVNIFFRLISSSIAINEVQMSCYQIYFSLSF